MILWILGGLLIFLVIVWMCEWRDWRRDGTRKP